MLSIREPTVLGRTTPSRVERLRRELGETPPSMKAPVRRCASIVLEDRLGQPVGSAECPEVSS